MKHPHCVICGTTNDLQQHHIDPVVYGKSKRTKKKNKNYDPNKSLKDCSVKEIFGYLHDLGHMSDDGEMTVCSYHHNILHGIVKFQKAEHSTMIKEALKKAVENGVKLGRPTTMTKNVYINILELFIQGVGLKKIAVSSSVGQATVYKIIKEATGYKPGVYQTQEMIKKYRESFYPKTIALVEKLKNV